MTQQEFYDLWAPADGLWSDWVKPVLLAHVDPAAASIVIPTDPRYLDWLPPADGRCGIVVDLPAPDGLSTAATMARRGYRPVPLYNAVPAPGAVCDMRPHLRGLGGLTLLLASIALPPDAPPVFLLDSGRRFGTDLRPGRFDNRSVSLPTDFPSANLLLHRGLSQIILLQAAPGQPQQDLSHTLYRWQQAGIRIDVVTLTIGAVPQPCRVARPSLLGVFFQRVVATMGLQRNPLGGFGGVLPEPSSGGAG